MGGVMVGLVVAIFVLIFIGGFVLLQPKPLINEEPACFSDSDCVPASCCHSSSVVNVRFAPDCSGIVCSAICEPNTMDCGQGKPACVSGRCGVTKGEQKR